MPTLEDDFASEAKGGGTSDAPSAKESVSSEGYNQTYIIHRKNIIPDLKEVEDDDAVHEVFFRCGNWCYRGPIQFNGLKMGTAHIPIIIPTLQKQQGSLRYFCNANAVPKSSVYADQVAFLNQAIDFVAQELTSPSVEEELSRMTRVYPWIEEANAKTYFELELSAPACMRSAALIASKTYTRGLIIVSIFFESALYVNISQEATSDVLWFIEADLARRVSISSQCSPTHP